MNIHITTTFLGDTDTPNSFLGQAGKLAAVNATEDALEFIDLPPAGSSPISGTYSDFDNLKSTNALETGRFYLMTDFATIYDQPDYDDADNAKAVVVTKTAPVDPILLLATSSNTFAKEVWRPSTPKHRLEYDFVFVVTEVMGASAKGRITYCKDEFDNETHYDHTVVLLKRYESVSGSGIFNSFWDTGFGSTEVLTFGAGSASNKIGDNLVGGFVISNNVLGTNSVGNIIGIRSYNNTFGNNTGSNTFGHYTNNNTFGIGTYYNTFGHYTNNNTFGNGTNTNTFGEQTQYNTFGNTTQRNTFGHYTQNNTFGNITSNNTFGNNTGSNTFGNDTNNNTFYNNITSINFTTSTHLNKNYNCEIFKPQDGTFRLRYTNSSDVLVVVAPTA